MALVEQYYTISVLDLKKKKKKNAEKVNTQNYSFFDYQKLEINIQTTYIKSNRYRIFSYWYTVIV